MELVALFRVLGQQPGLLVVDVEVSYIREMHDLAHGTGAVACFHSGSNLGQGFVRDDAIKYRTIRFAKSALELFLDKAGTTAGDVDVLADQITVDLGDEVIEIEVDGFHGAGELAGKIVAQPFRVQLLLQVAFSSDERATRFRHLGTIHREEAMGTDAGRYSEAAFMEHGGPEQGMEVENILADEVNQFGFSIGFPVGIEIQAFLFGECLEGPHVTDGGIEPDIKVLARGIWDGKAEIRCIARDIPITEFVFAGGAQPLLHRSEERRGGKECRSRLSPYH